VARRPPPALSRSATRARWPERVAFVLALAVVAWWGAERIAGGGDGPALAGRISGPGSVAGSYTLLGARGSDAGGRIEARRTGRRARGTVLLANRPYVFDGRVTCLEVQSDRAVIGVVGVTTAPGGPPRRRGGLVTVVDGAGSGNDSVAYDLREGRARPDCSAPVSFAAQSAASTDTLVVRPSRR
jgi:hypothetical protein